MKEPITPSPTTINFAIQTYIHITHSNLSVHQGLHYKDYHLITPPTAMTTNPTKPNPPAQEPKPKSDWSFEELDTVKEFAAQMDDRGVLEWWRKAMDFAT
jgi:hypothetical protein